MVVQEGLKHNPEQTAETQPSWTHPEPNRNLTLGGRVVEFVNRQNCLEGGRGQHGEDAECFTLT